MPRPRPLAPGTERRTLAFKLGRNADRLRQIATKLGARPYRCFLVWERWTNPDERGSGDPIIHRRIEVLPTPRVADLGGLAQRQWSIGAVPDGSIRIDRISGYAYTEDELRGLIIPPASPDEQPPTDPKIAATGLHNDVEYARNMDFYWEVVEDTRGDNPAYRRRFKWLGGPYRNAESAEWTIVLQRASQDDRRSGRPALP